MARKNVTQYFDDLDNTPLDKDELRVIRFGLHGKNYVLDLSEKNAETFLKLLEPYVQVAQETADRDNRLIEPAAVRKWAQKEGLTVADRGKIPFEIIDAYKQAHPFGES